MLVISTQAPDLQQQAEVAPYVDASDDLPFEVVEAPILSAPPARVVAPPTRVSQPKSHRHEMSVFRPPCAALA